MIKVHIKRKVPSEKMEALRALIKCSRLLFDTTSSSYTSPFFAQYVGISDRPSLSRFLPLVTGGWLG